MAVEQGRERRAMSQDEKHLCRITVKFSDDTHRAFIVNKWVRDNLWHCSVHCSTQPDGTFQSGWDSYPGRKTPAKAVNDVIKEIFKGTEQDNE